jgi:hypothetical protein
MQLITNFNKMINRAITRTMDSVNNTIIESTTESLMGMQLDSVRALPVLCAEEMDFLSINEWIKEDSQDSHV